MKRCLLKASRALALSAVGLTALLFLTRSRPVLLRVAPDDNIRPGFYCLLNPFRDRAPENVAEAYLNKLREGRVEVIAPHVGENSYVLEKEKEWPIQSWRVSGRADVEDTSELVYRVKRGNGYSENGREEEVRFWMVGRGSAWELKNYGAIY